MGAGEGHPIFVFFWGEKKARKGMKEMKGWMEGGNYIQWRKKERMKKYKIYLDKERKKEWLEPNKEEEKEGHKEQKKKWDENEHNNYKRIKMFRNANKLLTKGSQDFNY